MASLNFDATTVEPQQSFEAIPAGNYLCLIEESDLVETKAGTGVMLSMKANILEGPYKDRKLFIRLNVQNQNPTAQEIGQRQLSQLCHAVGKLQVGDSAELHFIPFIARVTVRQNPNTGENQNEVREFKPASGDVPATATTSRPAFNAPRASAPASKPPAATAGNSSKPAWAK